MRDSLSYLLPLCVMASLPSHHKLTALWTVRWSLESSQIYDMQQKLGCSTEMVVTPSLFLFSNSKAQIWDSRQCQLANSTPPDASKVDDESSSEVLSQDILQTCNKMHGCLLRLKRFMSNPSLYYPLTEVSCLGTFGLKVSVWWMNATAKRPSSQTQFVDVQQNWKAEVGKFLGLLCFKEVNVWESFELSRWPEVSGELNAEYWQVESIPESRQLKSRDLFTLMQLSISFVQESSIMSFYEVE